MFGLCIGRLYFLAFQLNYLMKNEKAKLKVNFLLRHIDKVVCFWWVITYILLHSPIKG